MKASMQTFAVITSMEALVEAFVDDRVKVRFMEAF